jgi:predicted Zn-dependent peptidase
MVVAYKRPDQYSPDAAAMDVLAEILAGGRTSILYKDMVRDKQMALASEAIAAYPGSKYPGLFLFFVVPNEGHSLDENEKTIYEIVERLKTQGVDAAAVQRVKTKLRAGLIGSLANNGGLAETLASYQAGFGDWRKVFTELDEYNKVTPAEVQRVAKKYLIDTSRTVAWTYVPEGASK